MSANSSVLVGCSQGTVWAKVEGRGTFQTSPGLKKYSVEMMSRGFQHFVIDLAECETMDSTFMGTLAGISLHLRERGPGSLKVIRANQRNLSLLVNLGLDQIFEVLAGGLEESQYQDQPSSPPGLTGSIGQAANEQDARRQMIEAHRNLIRAQPENAVRFRDVLEVLDQSENGERPCP